jgi:hypothetical protein
MVADRDKFGPVISVRLPEKKHSEYVSASLAAGVSLSKIVRRCLDGVSPQIVVGDGNQRRVMTQQEVERLSAAASAAKRAKPPRATDEERRLLYLFSKASNNINQLAHRANADHLAGKLSEQTYEDILYNLELIARYMKATTTHAD